MLKIAFLPLLLTPLMAFSFCEAPRQTGASGRVSTTGKDSIPYDLLHPALVIHFENQSLKEISGIGPTEVPGEFVAIADERGEIFFINAEKGGTVTRNILFKDKGDFEGVELVDNVVWALKSDGDLYAISQLDKETPLVESYKTPLRKKDDVEGLGYDPQRKGLLLACKTDPDTAGLRNVYLFQLQSRSMAEKPVYQIDPLVVNQLVPYLDTERHDYFSPSAIAVHPQTKDIYVISTALKRLVILDYQSGAIKYAQRLDKKLLPQPEGISFDKAGNLYISSEGKDGAGLLLRYDSVKKHHKQ